MRNLGDAASVAWQRGNVSLAITPQDKNDTWTFGLPDLAGLTPISFEVPFGGGLAKPSLYTATLSTSVGWWLQNKTRLGRADAVLTMSVGSASFQVHVGKVRGIDLDPLDLNKVNLQVVDRFLDTDPLVPVEALVDSWSTPHLEDLQSGYPLYYGDQSKRPATLAAVTSDCSVFLGARNISSANHTMQLNRNEIYFFDSAFGASDRSAVALRGGGNAFRTWDPLTNISSAPGFILGLDQGGLPAVDNPLYGMTGFVQTSGTGPTSAYLYASANLGLATNIIFVNSPSGFPSSSDLGFQFFKKYSRITSTYWLGVLLTYNVNSPGLGGYIAVQTSGALSNSVSYNPAGGAQNSLGFAGTDFMLNNGTNRLFWTIAGSGTVPLLELDLFFQFVVSPDAYRRYGVYMSTNLADVAISTNPWAILDDVTSRYTLTPYRQDQSSAVQVLIQSYQFNSLFHERQLLSAILGEFGETCGVMIWQGDSGMVNYRAYAESASVSVDRVVASGDYLTAHLLSNPLGTTAFQTQGFSKFTVDYAYDYQLGKYTSTAAADRNSSALCGSAWAAGVQKAQAKQSRHIMSAAVASLYLGQLVRKAGQTQDFIELDLPHPYLGLEAADVIQVYHPALPGGADVFQVTQLKLDLVAGTVHVLAGRLLSAAGG